MNKVISVNSDSGTTPSPPLHLRSVFICCLLSLFCLLSFISCATTPNTKEINKAEAYNKLGVSYLKNSQTNRAYIEFQKAINLNPKNKETLNYLGYINALYKKHDEAILHYKRAISIDPDYSDALNNLGVAYLDIEKWDDAIDAFSRALENPLYVTPEKAYSSMGYAYYMKGNYTKAEKYLREALMRNPVYPLANYSLGLVYIKLNSDEKAIEELMKAIAIHSEYVSAHWELANIYLKIGKNAKAIKHFDIVAEKDKGSERGRMADEQIEKLKY